jgi:hypothetical protein
MRTIAMPILGAGHHPPVELAEYGLILMVE